MTRTQAFILGCGVVVLAAGVWVLFDLYRFSRWDAVRAAERIIEREGED